MSKKYMNKEWLRNELVSNGKTYKEVAEQFGVGYTTIANRAKSYGIKIKSSRADFKDNSLLKNKEWLFKQYITLGKRMIDIADENDLSEGSVRNWLKNHGISKTYEQAFKRERAFLDSCKECGNDFTVRPSSRKVGQGYFCGSKCSSTYLYPRGKGAKIRQGHKEFSQSPEGIQFFIDKGKRTSRMLARGHKSSIEVAIEGELTNRGIRFEDQKAYKLGIADVFIEPNIYVFADGDYWHALDAVNGVKEPTDKQAYQIAKDIRQTGHLEELGNVVFRFWEHEIHSDVEACVDIVLAEINAMEAIA